MPFVLKTACTRGKLDLETARQILDALGKLPIEIDTSPAPGQRQLFELAMSHEGAAWPVEAPLKRCRHSKAT